jgi:hypothetical protein
MKRFITSILFVSIFFIGLGSLVEKAGAKFKSDEKALELIRAARAAIGGESAIKSVQSMSIAGKTTHTMKLNGAERIEQGNTEIALQFPDKFSKMVKLGNGDGDTSKQLLRNKEVVIVDEVPGEGVKLPETPEGQGVKRVIVHNGDGTAEELNNTNEIKVIVRKGDGDAPLQSKVAGGEGDRILIRREGEHHEAMRHNEMLSTTLSLLLTAPEGMDVSYTYAGEGNVDGTPCKVVQADAAGATFKLYLSSESNLPVMISYVSNELPRMFIFEKKPGAGDDQTQDKMIFNAKVPAPQSAEAQVKFSDYRSVEGLQLPFRWSKTVSGSVAETLEVASYEINPSNIAEKFQQPKVLLRTKKEGQN